MTAKLSTHALDLYRGGPAAGLRLRLYRLEPSQAAELLLETVTNEDGRTASPLLEGDAMMAGCYEIVFMVGEYFASLGVSVARPPFLGEVPVRFAVADIPAAYHVPLLFSPWAYSTYRGS